MNKTQHILAQVDKYISAKPHKERLVLLFGGWLVIYLFWFFTVNTSHQRKMTEIKDKIKLSVEHIHELNSQAITIITDAKKNPDFEKNMEKKKLESIRPYQSANKQIDIVFKQMVSTVDNLKNLNLTNSILATPTNADSSKLPEYNLKITFTGNYQNTVNYLSKIESLPWCLAWQDLSYSVTTYPDASVIVTLHTASVTDGISK
jgi:Tfp pilus assembly protein PilO